MPKELICPAHRELALADYDDSAPPGPGEVRIRNRFGAEKHGTMLSFWRGHGNQRGAYDGARQLFDRAAPAWIGYPFGLGNMAVGDVDAVGSDVDGLRAGDRVLHYCSFRPTAVRNAGDVWKLPAATDWRSAVCLDPLVYALCPLRDGNARLGDAIAIVGLGAIGLMAVQAARLAGLGPIIALDPLASRRAVAAKTGADVVLDPTDADAGLAMRDATGGRGPDVVLEYSGSVEGLQAALRGVAFGGTVVMGAFPGPYKAGLDFGAEAHMNRPNLVFSRSESEPWRDHPRWSHARVRDVALRLITDGRIDGSSVVTPVATFGPGIVDAYREMAEHPETHIKLGVRYA